MRASLRRLFPVLLCATLVCVGLQRPIASSSGTEQPTSTRAGQAVNELADGRLLITGGDAAGTAEIQDPASGVTTPLESTMTAARVQHSGVRLADGMVLLVGGYTGGPESVERSAEIFDPQTLTFTKIGGTRLARILPSLTLRADGVVVISGGSPDALQEFYDPASGSIGLDPAAPYIGTDRDDYAPGETVLFTGGRWAPGESVTIVLKEQPAMHGDLVLLAVADDAGVITNSEFQPEEHDIAVTFLVTATGELSGTATTVFTDAAPPSSGYTITSSSGTPLSGGSDIGNHCDDCNTFIGLPFPVTFYDAVFTGASVSSNGAIYFGGSAFQNPNFCLPSSIFPGRTILPFWDDLRTDFPSGTGKGIFTQMTGTAPDRQFHVRWNVSYFRNASPQFTGQTEFSVVLYENSPRLDFLYGGSTGGSGTVGVQRSSAGPSTQYGCQISAVGSGTRLIFNGTTISTPTTTTLTAAPGAGSVIGQSVTLTGTVRWGGTNTVTSGTMTLKEGATTLGSGTVNANGQVSVAVSSLSTGTHALTATYAGSGAFQASSGNLSYTVAKGNTTTTVVSNTNPSVVGQSVTFTATVNAVSPASGARTGTVQFRDNGVDIGGPVVLSANQATLTTSFTSTGAHSITGVYAGDGNFAGSTSPTLVQTVNKADTTTSVGADINPSAFDQSVTFTAIVTTQAPGTGTAAGSVQFKAGGVNIGPLVPLVSGAASLSTSTLAVGPHSITAVYGGDSGFNQSTSAALSQTVNKAAATLALGDLMQIYDGSPKVATVTTNPPGLTGVTVTYDDSAASPTNHKPGGYVVVASLSNPNYTAADATGTLVIDKAVATLMLGDLTHTYDGSPKAATVTTSPVGLGVVTVTYDGFNTAPTNHKASGYAVVASLDHLNYSAVAATGTLVIEKAEATITLSNLVHTYDGTAKAATVTTSPPDLATMTVTYDGSPTAPIDHKDGGYAVVASLANQNYAAADATGTLQIDKAAATLSLATLIHTYDGSPKAATATTTPTDLAGVSITYDGSPTPPTNHKPGGYAVIASLTHANYAATAIADTLLINKAQAVVDVSGYTGVYDGGPHGATGSATGVGSANLGSLLDLGASFTAVPGGTAQWTFNAGNVNPNYESATGSVEVSIGPRPASVTADAKSRIYGDGNPPLTATVSGIVTGQTLNYTLATAASAASAVGAYSITVTLGSNPNYEVTPQDGMLSVTTASLIVLTDNLSRQYGSPNPALTGSLNGLKNGDPITATRTTTAGLTSSIGGYPITAALSDPDGKLSNYSVTNAGGTLLITQAPLTIVADSASRPFGASTPPFSGSYSGQKNGETFTLTFSSSAVASSPVGTYPIVPTASGPTLGNYSVVAVNGTLTVSAWAPVGFHAPVGQTNSVITVPAAAAPTQSAVWNTIKGGQTVPLKFNLYEAAGGTEMTSVSDVAGFTLMSVGCTAAPEDTVEADFTTSGATALRYDGVQFVQNWQSPKNANRCYRVTMQARDGSKISAFFKTK